MGFLTLVQQKSQRFHLSHRDKKTSRRQKFPTALQRFFTWQVKFTSVHYNRHGFSGPKCQEYPRINFGLLHNSPAYCNTPKFFPVITLYITERVINPHRLVRVCAITVGFTSRDEVVHFTRDYRTRFQILVLQVRPLFRCLKVVLTVSTWFRIWTHHHGTNNCQQIRTRQPSQQFKHDMPVIDARCPSKMVHSTPDRSWLIKFRGYQTTTRCYCSMPGQFCPMGIQIWDL